MSLVSVSVNMCQSVCTTLVPKGLCTLPPRPQNNGPVQVLNQIINKKDTANARHFNSKGHTLSDFRALIIERVIPNDGAWLLEREDFWIKKLETKSPKGLNLND